MRSLGGLEQQLPGAGNMMPLKFGFAQKRPLRVLCLGAHSDDIEIGCGGTIIQLLADHPDSEFFWMVFSASPERAREAEKSANSYLEKVKRKEVVIKDFRDGFLPYIGEAVKQSFEDLKKRFNPDVIFTSSRHDLHQDHRLVSELTWNTFRDHLILEYEILKYDGDLGSPNVFVPLKRSTCAEKIRRLKECFKSQESNSWFDEECFYALMRIRGVESNSPTNYAEAFFCRKSIIDFNS
jgi:LmbE family N-acetylglucosaminyl deacetylase